MRLKKLSTGIYRDRYSIRAIVNTSVGRKEKRFPLDAPLKDIKRWREECRGKFAALARRRGPVLPKAKRGTLRGDAARYVKYLTIASASSRRSDLAAWLALYGEMPSYRLRAEHARAAVHQWLRPDARTIGKGKAARQQPYKAWTIRHRIEALRAFYKWLDGPDAPTPVDGLDYTRPGDGHPVFVAPATIEAVAAQLDRYPATKARHLVLATHGVRPVELMRAQPEDVNTSEWLWVIRSAKGGVARVLRLNTPEMQHAWSAFIAANAWGPYDTTQHARRLRKAGWPAGVRPYALRGTWGMELSRRGTDLADIQHLMGHRDIETTRIYYVPTEESRLALATKATAGRIKVGE